MAEKSAFSTCHFYAAGFGFSEGKPQLLTVFSELDDAGVKCRS